MTTRPRKILQRFPAHLEPARPDKQLWSVVEALAGDLDVLSTDLALSQPLRVVVRLADNSVQIVDSGFGANGTRLNQGLPTAGAAVVDLPARTFRLFTPKGLGGGA